MWISYDIEKTIELILDFFNIDIGIGTNIICIGT